MKNVFMILFLLSGLAISTVSAQNCSPCPPGCCVASCCLPGKSSAAEANSASGVATLAVFSPEALQAICVGKNISKKDMKACQTASAAAPNDQSHVAFPATSVRQTAPTTPSCQPSCQTGKRGNSSSVSAAQPATIKVVQAKG